MQLLADLRCGKILAVMLAPPCTTSSRARRVRLRSREHPWGFPHLEGRDREQVENGNSCILIVLSVIRMCHRFKIPFVVENPHSSMLWDVPELAKFLTHESCHVRVLDFCFFGTAWKKPTRLLLGNIPFADTASLDARCAGRGGWCSTSRAKHFLLEGPGPGGVPRTRTAQEYPKKLCKLLADVLTAPARDQFASSFAPHFKRTPGCPG